MNIGYSHILWCFEVWGFDGKIKRYISISHIRALWWFVGLGRSEHYDVTAYNTMPDFSDKCDVAHRDNHVLPVTW